MTLQELERSLLQIRKELSEKNEILKRVEAVAGKRLEAEYKQRIFVDGLDSKLKQIGKYATSKGLYVNPKGPTLKGVKKSNFKPMGKNGKDTFKNGKKKKTKYVANSWAGVRKLAGRQNNKVDLNFSGASFQSIALGFVSGRLVLGSTSKGRLKILRAMERKYRTSILAPSKREKDAFIQAYASEVQFIIRKYIK